MKLPTSFFQKYGDFESKYPFYGKRVVILWEKCDFGQNIECIGKIFFSAESKSSKDLSKVWKNIFAQNCPPPRFGKMPFFWLFMDLGWCVGEGSTPPSIKKFFSWAFNSIFLPNEVLWPPLQNSKPYFEKTLMCVYLGNWNN